MLAFALSSLALAVPVSPASPHTATIAFEVADALGGCAVADVDPGANGREIVVTSRKGVVFVISRGADGAYSSEVVFRSPGEMIQVAAGDADPRRPGDEIVVVGMAEGPEDDAGPGAAHVIYKDGGAWKSAKIFENGALVHGVGIGDAGVFVTGYDRKVHLLRARPDGRFETVSSAALPGNGKAALAVDGGAWIACTDGSLVKATVDPAEGRLEAAVIDRRASGRSRLGTDGPRVIVSDDDGTLSLVDRDGKRTEIFQEGLGEKLRGAVLADLDPASPGLEAATTGYSGRVWILYPRSGAPAGRFEPRLLFRDRAGFHHAAAGDLDGRPGDELVVCGLAGRVIVFSFD
jgi:hypothetical protein